MTELATGYYKTLDTEWVNGQQISQQAKKDVDGGLWVRTVTGDGPDITVLTQSYIEAGDVPGGSA